MNKPTALRGLALAQSLVRDLPDSHATLFNPWKQSCVHDLEADGPAQRLARLGQHLECEARLILLGEAIGYQGGRYSGIAFTSERLLLAGQIPRVGCNGRLTDRQPPFSEPSATIVWRELHALGVADRTVLWNSLPLHPHRPAEPWSNRTPTPREVAIGAPALERLMAAFPRATVIAVGRHAAALIRETTGREVEAVRHPARGGATRFALELRERVAAR